MVELRFLDCRDLVASTDADHVPEKRDVRHGIHSLSIRLDPSIKMKPDTL